MLSRKLLLISVFATTKLADKKVGGGAVKEINVLITAQLGGEKCSMVREREPGRGRGEPGSPREENF